MARVSDNSLCKSKSAQDPDSPSSSQTVLRVRHIQRLIGRPPLVSIVGLVAQVSGRLNTLVSPGEDLDAQALLVLHWDDLFGCRCSETVESHDFSGGTWRNSFSACRDYDKTHVRLVTPDSEADFMASESMYSEVPLGASGNCKDHLICSPCWGDSRARTTIPMSWGKGGATTSVGQTIKPYTDNPRLTLLCSSLATKNRLCPASRRRASPETSEMCICVPSRWEDHSAIW
jgi:hypothetical protein